jgi:hypothetical protein
MAPLPPEDTYRRTIALFIDGLVTNITRLIALKEDVNLIIEWITKGYKSWNWEFMVN